MAGSVEFGRGFRRVSMLFVVMLLSAGLFAIKAPAAHAFNVNTDCKAVPEGVGVPDGLPIATDDAFTTAWNVPISPSVLGNDFDGTGTGGQDGLQTYLWSSAVQHGSLTLNQNGTFDYVPNVASTSTDAVDTFQYILHNTNTDYCSPSPATVTITITGFTETVEQAPSGNPDSYPADGTPMSATDVLTIPAPGVLANDYNGVNHAPNDNLEAHLLSQPVWAGTEVPAGTITDWGVTMVQGVPVTNDSGGFTFTPGRNNYGTAEFTYEACYIDRPVTAAECSPAVRATIAVAPTTVADPITMFVGDDGVGHVTVSDFLAHVTWNLPQPIQYVSTVPPTHGSWVAVADGFEFHADSTFDGSDQAKYIACSTPPPATPATVCTNQALINIVAEPPTPHVISVDLPTGPDKPIVVTFDQQVKGITSANVVLNEIVGSTTVQPIPAHVQCQSALQPGSNTNCGLFADTALLYPDSPLQDRHIYDLRVNEEVQGIVAYAAPNQQLVPYDRTFSAVFDSSPPVALPIVPATNAAGWNTGPVTVGWNWSDGLGSGIDPAHCTTSSTSNVEGSAVVMSATCADKVGNVGTASYTAKIDSSAPVALPIVPPTNAAGWYTGDVSIGWSWFDGPGSGIDPAHCTTSSTSVGQGAAVVMSATCADLAGNVGTASYTAKIDSSAPVALPIVPPTNAAGWYTGDVSIGWSWFDGPGSGIDPAHCTTSSTSVGQGAAVVMSATRADLAGNVGTASYTAKIDKTAPELHPIVPPNPVLLGSAASVDPNATDNASGVVSSSCGPLDTSTVGAKTVRCTATDGAGNIGSVDVPYVVGFGVGQLSPPPKSKFKSGSTIPMKFELTGAGGQPISAVLSRSLPACAVKVVLGAQAPVCATYDPLTNRFQANLKIPANAPVGTELLIRVTVTLGGTIVGTATTSITVTK